MELIVVGAGIAGLGAATYAARSGHRVRVLEASDRAGGRAKTLVRDRTGDRCDVGTQYYHSSYRRALGLIREVGLGPSLSKIHGNSRYYDKRARSGSFLLGHRLPYFPVIGVSGNLRLLSFITHRLIRHRIDTFALEDRPHLDLTRAYDIARHPDLDEFLVRPLMFAGALSEPEPIGVSLLHLIRLARIIVLTDYLSLSGGMASLHEALAARLDVSFESPVERLVVEGGRVVGVALEGSGEVIRADHVIVATTAPRAETILPDEWTKEREFLQEVRIPSFTLTTFFLDRPLEKSVWSYVFPSSGNRKVTFCVDQAQKNPAMVPSGKAILQAWPCYPASAEMEPLDDGAAIETCRKALEEYFPDLSSWIEEAAVTRHPYGVPWFPVGHHSRALEFLASADRRPGVSFCGDYLSGGYLEPALWSAERAVSRLG